MDHWLNFLALLIINDCFSAQSCQLLFLFSVLSAALNLSIKIKSFEITFLFSRPARVWFLLSIEKCTFADAFQHLKFYDALSFFSLDCSLKRTKHAVWAVWTLFDLIRECSSTVDSGEEEVGWQWQWKSSEKCLLNNFLPAILLTPCPNKQTNKRKQKMSNSLFPGCVNEIEHTGI